MPDPGGLDPRQQSLLAAITARLIPSGSSGPGALEAKVDRYIGRALEGDYRSQLQEYVGGLTGVDATAISGYGRPFIELAAAEQDAVLSSLESGAAGTELQGFFERVLQHTREGMFGDPSWGGNEGYGGWRLIGYPGPRYRWTADDQRLDAVIEPRYGDRGPR